MRELTKKQKQLLDKWFKDNKNSYTGLAVRDIVRDCLPNELWLQLQELNDTEILYQNVNNYIHDKASNQE